MAGAAFAGALGASMRGRNENATTPIIILSGEPLEDDEVSRLGAAGSVLKPFDVPTLVAMIRAHLAN